MIADKDYIYLNQRLSARSAFVRVPSCRMKEYNTDRTDFNPLRCGMSLLTDNLTGESNDPVF